MAGTRTPRSVPARPIKAKSGENRSAAGCSDPALFPDPGLRLPRSFFAVAPDSWPGDPAIGQRLIMGELLARGSAGAVRRIDDPPWRRPGAPTLWVDALNGFAWLRDLRDCGDPSAAAACRSPGRRLVELRGPLVARHLEARGVGRAHRLVDPPLRLAGHGRRPWLLRPLRLLARPPAHPSQAGAAHRPGRPRGGRGAEGA